jgi:membrane protein insertase Oxa1/YidC/SpoIIIJ
LATFVPILAQMPIFMSFFFGLQRMATDYPSLVSGGTLWFEDLTVADPTYGLPLLASLSFLITIELGGEAGQQQQNPGQAKTMKNVMRAMAVGMVPLTMAMPCSVFMYWITSNTFSCIQTATLKLPGVKAALGIPTPSPDASKTTTGTTATSTTSLPNFSTNMSNIAPPPPPTEMGTNATQAKPAPADLAATVNRKKRKARRQKRRK